MGIVIPKATTAHIFRSGASAPMCGEAVFAPFRITEEEYAQLDLPQVDQVCAMCIRALVPDKITLVVADRPETQAEGDSYFICIFRNALTECADILKMPGTPLLDEVPIRVRKLKQKQELLERIRIKYQNTLRGLVNNCTALTKTARKKVLKVMDEINRLEARL